MESKKPGLELIKGGKTDTAQEPPPEQDYERASLGLLRIAFADYSGGKIYSDEEIITIMRIVERQNPVRRKAGIRELKEQFPELTEFFESLK